MSSFKALRVHDAGKGVEARLDSLTLDQLSEGQVVIRSAWSGINYKDALAVTGKGKIIRKPPLNAGIDVSGTVETSEDPRFLPGDEVLVTGWGLGEIHDGGFSEFVRVPGDWVVPLQDPLDLRQAMAVGTAGFTAALSLVRMEQSGLAPDQGPILVNGATGGVGSFAIRLFSRAGYSVTALTGKTDAADYLKSLGATDIMDAGELDPGNRPLEKGLWAGSVDSLGGEALAWLTRTTKPWGYIAAVGLAQGIELNTTVMPFIIRGVSLIGIDSPLCPRDIRLATWKRLAGLLRPEDIDAVVSQEVGLDGVVAAAGTMMERRQRGRTLVKLG
ncbi:MAG: oxidoreductase [Ectothiorhodospiraceae bacterium]|nr:oxidoreductase [Ectothiorhodospiraceae bacterium]MCH8504706.1 oxidoreductase [Ectothiorhodospiraceae bacterium]